MGKWLKISQQPLHSTCNTPLLSISQGFPGSLNRQVKGEHGGLRVWPFEIRSQHGEAACLWFLVWPFPMYSSILNLRFLLRYVFFQELTSSPLPKHEVPISPPLPSESHCAARLILPECWCHRVILFRTLCNNSSQPLLQGIFATQGSNTCLLHCRWILDQLSHQGSPRMLEWAAYPFSSGSPQPRNWTGVSCIAANSLPAELPGKPPVTTPPSLEGKVHCAYFGSALLTRLMAHCSSHLQPRLNPWAFAHPSVLSHSSFLP